MDKSKYFLIYLDILGFGPLAAQIASEKGIEQRKVRNEFIEVIKEKIDALGAKGKIIGQKYGNSDDWILVIDSLDKGFNCIYEILEHNTGYLGYEKIPLEIAMGIGKFDKWARFDGKNLVIEDSAIDFLKTDIIGHYRKWYKENHNQSPKSTFILLTESAHQKLEPLDKKICQQIEYKRDPDKERIVTFFVADADKVTLRGKAYAFTGEIDYPGHKWYGRIEELYVPPLEYEDIKNTLKEKRLVFITGSPEYGKTYTAVRLMWEYYNKGYEPKWIKGGEPLERINVRQRLENIEAELKPDHILYFEDPFGKLKYEKREGLEREIGTIIEAVNQIKNVYVIITSREEVFKEFEKERISELELEEFEQKLNLKKPSYDLEKRKEILLRLAEIEICKWLKYEYLTKLLLNSLKDNKILPTILSIKEFVLDTINTENLPELNKKLQKKSKETAKAFASEIKKMSEDKVLFLLFPFISIYNPIQTELIRKTYRELVEELNLLNAMGFDRILDWFKNDKINFYSVSKYIEFSHPSYYQALDYILFEDGNITWINNKILSKLLINLSKKGWSAENVSIIIAKNFIKFPDEVRNLLFTLSDKEWGLHHVARAVADNFDKLPDEIRTKLLINLSEKGQVNWKVAVTVAENFDKLPDEVRNLLFTLSDKDNGSRKVAVAIAENFDKLPDEVRNLLFTLLEKDPKFEPLVISYIFDKLPLETRDFYMEKGYKFLYFS